MGSSRGARPRSALQRLEARFDALRPDALRDHGGEWTLIDADGSVSYFAAEHDAVVAGYQRGRGAQFLVKQMLGEDKPIRASAALLTTYAP